MSLLEITNLSLRIHETLILRDISLTVQPGKIVGIIGESGSGKSMTAFSILQLLPDNADLDGSINFNGSELLDTSEHDLCAIRGFDIGMVFQEPMTALNPVKTIGDQVAETILIHEKNTTKWQARERAQKALTRVDLPTDRFPLSRYPHELSGGQRQRVVIAMAIALQPKLLIADEPTTALDVTTQAQILRLLKRLVQEDSMGLLMITHDLAVVADMADDIVIMKDGSIVESGPANTLFSTMQHPYTRALLEASSHVPLRKIGHSATPLLQVSSVSRDYHLPRKALFGPAAVFRAVQNVSFQISIGENLGLVGESGCGKSTLTRAILGLEQVQSGSILLDGAPVFVPKGVNRAVRQKMQAVFQDPYGSFNPRHDVARLVSEPFHLKDTPPTGKARDVAVCEVLESVGLEGRDRHKYIHEFSGGQRQRIAIARALILKPELIILDEAVSALDVSVRAQVLDLLADLSDRFALTYLFISHDLSVVRSITDRVLVMKSGEIVEQGKTDQVFSNPQHPYTQSLIAAAPQLPTASVSKKDNIHAT